MQLVASFSKAKRSHPSRSAKSLLLLLPELAIPLHEDSPARVLNTGRHADNSSSPLAAPM